MRILGFDGQGGGTYGRTDVWKLPPVSYRTSALWGRCPKKDKNELNDQNEQNDINDQNIPKMMSNDQK